jgi:D-arabinose 1-dehydrogenase-like Zn-dependent alcohol dehydrogenase
VVGVKVVGAAATGTAAVKSAKAMAKRVIARSSYLSSRQCYAVRDSVTQFETVLRSLTHIFNIGTQRAGCQP